MANPSLINVFHVKEFETLIHAWVFSLSFLYTCLVYLGLLVIEALTSEYMLVQNMIQ
jgi:hypothetical protein